VLKPLPKPKPPQEAAAVAAPVGLRVFGPAPLSSANESPMATAWQARQEKLARLQIEIDQRSREREARLMREREEEEAAKTAADMAAAERMKNYRPCGNWPADVMRWPTIKEVEGRCIPLPPRTCIPAPGFERLKGCVICISKFVRMAGSSPFKCGLGEMNTLKNVCKAWGCSDPGCYCNLKVGDKL